MKRENRNTRSALNFIVMLILALEGIFFTIYYDDGFSIWLTARFADEPTIAESRFKNNVREASKNADKRENLNVIYIDVSNGFLVQTKPSDELLTAANQTFSELRQSGLLTSDQNKALKYFLDCEKTMSTVIQLMLLKQVYDLTHNGGAGYLDIWLFANSVDIMSKRLKVEDGNFEKLINDLATKRISGPDSLHTDFINLFAHPDNYGNWPKRGKVNMTIISDFIQSTPADGDEAERRAVVQGIKEFKNNKRLSFNLVHLGDRKPKPNTYGDWSIFEDLDQNLVRKSFYIEPDISSNRLNLKGLTYPEIKFDDPVIVQYDMLGSDSLYFVMDFDIQQGGDSLYIRLGRNEYEKNNLPMLDVRCYRVDKGNNFLRGSPIMLSRGIPVSVFLDIDQRLLLAYSGISQKREKLVISSAEQNLNYTVDVLFKEKPRKELIAMIIFNFLVVLVLFFVFLGNFLKKYLLKSLNNDGQ